MSELRNNEGIRREGLTVLHNPHDAVLDVFIIHGLNGSPYSTFRSEESGFFWPRDLFRHIPPARIILFGYISNVAKGSGNYMGVQQHAENFLLQLRNNRIERQRPIVFLGHSLGGLVIKQTLILSSNRKTDADILHSTKIVVFFGVPHRGSSALQKSRTQLAIKIGPIVNHAVPPSILPTLLPEADEAYMMNTQFMQIKAGITIMNFYEQSPQGFVGGLVVGRESAVFDSETSENVPVFRNHRDLVRFHSSNDDFYHTICQTLHRTTMDILERIAQAKDEETSLRLKEELIVALGDPLLPSMPDQPKGPHPGSLQWLWGEESQFMRWIRKGSGIFAIAGKPGSGKSVLMSALNRVIRKHFTTEFPIAVHHFFNSRGKQVEKTVDGFLQSVLLQLILENPCLFDYIKDDWLLISRRKMTSGAVDVPTIGTHPVVRWALSDLTDLLFKSLKWTSQRHKIFILVDAVDECQTLNLSSRHVIDLFHKIIEECDEDTIHICFSCRDTPLYNIGHPSGGFSLHEKNQADILNFIETQWRGLSIGPRFDDEMRQLKKCIVHRADGIFLWVTLVLEDVQKAVEGGATLAEVKGIIDTPDQLHGVFSRLLSSVNPTHMPETRRILAIILTAKRPLNLKEIRYILALDSCAFKSEEDMKNSPDVIQDDDAMKRRIRNTCGGLVEVKMLNDALSNNEAGGVDENSIQFIHQSVRDFLEQGTEKHSTVLDLTTLMKHGHSVLGRACVAYLGLAEVQAIPGRLKLRQGQRAYSEAVLSTSRFPLLSYAEEHWISHGQEMEWGEESESSESRKIYNQYLSSPVLFDIWRDIHNKFHPTQVLNQDYDSNRLAVEYDLSHFVTMRCIDGLLDVDSWTQAYGSYLHLAISRSSIRTVEVLIRHGANIEARGPHNNTPLSDTCRKGNLNVAKLLLEAGAEVTDVSLTSSPFVASNNALAGAVTSGNVDLVKHLLNHTSTTYADPWYRIQAIAALANAGDKIYNEGGSRGFIRKVRASATDWAEISRILSEGIDFDHNDIPFLSPSNIWVLLGCQESSLLTLINTYRTSLEGHRQWIRPFINMACWFGTLRSVHMLVESVRVPEGLPDWIGHPESVQYLTPVHYAAINHSSSILSHLLELGLSPDSQDKFGRTPMHMAAGLASDEHIYVLLSYGANKEIKSHQGLLPFHLALQGNNFQEPIKVFEKLLTKQSDVNLTICNGLSPLHMAAESGALVVVEWLLKRGANINLLDEFGRTILHLAATSTSPDGAQILEVLLGRGQDVDARDGVDMTSLHHVLYTYDPLDGKYDPDIALAHAKILLHHGADVDAQDQEGNTLLHLAAWRSHKDIIRLCLGKGAVVTKRDCRGLMPVDLASDDDIRDMLEAASMD